MLYRATSSADSNTTVPKRRHPLSAETTRRVASQRVMGAPSAFAKEEQILGRNTVAFASSATNSYGYVLRVWEFRL